MAVNYGTLGLTLTPTPMYGTVQTTTSGPSPSGMPLYPIGTGRASGTSSVGTTIERGSDDNDGYTGTTDVTQIDPITSAPVNQFAKSYPSGIKGWIQESIDYALAPTVEYNRVTGTYRASDPGGAVSGMMGPLGGIMQGMAAISRANLEGIAEQAFKGSSKHAVGYLNGQIVGVSPGIFGGSVLSGNIPSNLSSAQRQAITQSLLGLENKAGAYTTYVDESGIPSQETYDPSFTYGGQGKFDSQYSDASTPVAITGKDYKTGTTTYSPASYDYSATSYEPPESISSNTGRDDSDDNSDGMGGAGGEGNVGSSIGGGGWGGYEGDAYGGTITHGRPQNRTNLAPGGRADGPGSESEGHSFHGGDVTEGFVNKDPEIVSDAQSIADNRYTSVKSGSFVVNQPANEKNKEKLDKIVADASKTTKMKKGGKAGMVDVALSDGERLIEPEVVAAIEKKHGKNFLDKLNDAGKPEVKRRQAKYGEKIGAAQGSFITDQGMELSDVGEDTDMEEYLPVSDELKAKLSKFAAKKPQRGQIKSFIKSLSPEDKLTVLFLTETQSTTDPVESMEAIGEVVKNRIGSDYYDFKDIKTLDDALLKQTRKGAFHFSGLEPSTLYARAKEVKKGLADKGLAKAYAAAQNVLDPETEGASRLPANTVFYTRKDAPSQWMRESKDLEFSTELGGHEFYRTFAAPELP